MSFKERVKESLIESARVYKDVFLDREYLIYSSKFKYKKYYEIAAKEDNFLHLTGVSTNLKAKLFFEKCYSSSLEIDDFEILTAQQKGSVRRKVNILKDALNIFYTEFLVEEKFIKNKISCSFASSDSRATLGFTKTEKAKPQTLLKGNLLKNPVKVEALFYRQPGEIYYNKIVILDRDKSIKIFERLKEKVRLETR